MMIVIDEYGGTEGLLTHEDVVEAVLGDLSDETDPTVRLVEEAPGRWLVDASLGVRTLAQLLDAKPEALGVRTIGGLVATLLGRLPQQGDSVRSGRVRLEVVSLSHHKPAQIRVTVKGAPADPQETVS